MTLKASEQYENDWQAAEEALAAAQGIPIGPERIAALRRAGQMRFVAYERKRAILDLMDGENERLRRGHPRE